MSETTTPTQSAPAPSRWTDPAFVVKTVGVAALGGSILALDLTGHAANSVFIQQFAIPALAVLGVHTAAKSLT